MIILIWIFKQFYYVYQLAFKIDINLSLSYIIIITDGVLILYIIHTVGYSRTNPFRPDDLNSPAGSYIEEGNDLDLVDEEDEGFMELMVQTSPI